MAVFNDTFYVVGAEWVFEFDVTTWGWIHILIGLLVAVAGFFVLSGAVWARTVGVIVACLSIVLNFVWLPVLPVVGHHHHRPRRLRDLGADAARAGHRRGLSWAELADGRRVLTRRHPVPATAAGAGVGARR